MSSDKKDVFLATIMPSKFVLLSSTNHVVAGQLQAFQCMSTGTALVVRNTMFFVKTPCMAFQKAKFKSLRYQPLAPSDQWTNLNLVKLMLLEIKYRI